MRKFITWEVWASLNGNVERLAVLPFRQADDAKMWAESLPKGYVLRGTAEREPQGCLQLAFSRGSRSWVCVKGQPATEDTPRAVPAPVPMTFAVWDATNGRLVRELFNGSPALTFASMVDAEQHAKELNAFGGYGGWLSLRFTAVHVPVADTLSVPDSEADYTERPARFQTFATG